MKEIIIENKPINIRTTVYKGTPTVAATFVLPIHRWCFMYSFNTC